jgi:hypothetical protein
MNRSRNRQIPLRTKKLTNSYSRRITEIVPREETRDIHQINSIARFASFLGAAVASLAVLAPNINKSLLARFCGGRRDSRM